MEIRSKSFPKLIVSLYDAPKNPEQQIAFSYYECIEDEKFKSPENIPLNKAKEVAEWVMLGGHTPALESIHLSFYIRGMSRIVSHQLVRHRVGVSIGQRTQRANCEEYLGNFFKGEHYVLPPSIREMKDPFYVTTYLEFAQDVYRGLIKAGISEDDARYLIPHCAETSMTFTVAYKALQHMCSVRLCRIMQGEIIEISRMMKQAVEEWNPFLANFLLPTCLINKRCNRNENNPNEENPKGVCEFTKNDVVPVRVCSNKAFDLTKYSKDNVR